MSALGKNPRWPPYFEKKKNLTSNWIIKCDMSFLINFVAGAHFWTSSYNYKPHESQNMITIGYSEKQFLLVV